MTQTGRTVKGVDMPYLSEDDVFDWLFLNDPSGGFGLGDEKLF